MFYDQETELSIFRGDNRGSASVSVIKNRSRLKKIKINSKKLSKYLENFKSIDLIKMGVEGF